MGLTALWARAYNDNYPGGNWFDGNHIRPGHANYMDNLDAFALLVPLTFEGVKVTPWGMYAAIGPNTFRAKMRITVIPSAISTIWAFPKAM